MFLPAHKFIIDHIGTIEPTPNGLHKYLEFILRKPARTDEFNDQVFPDDYFQCAAWNKKIEELPELEVGNKVEVMLNFQGRKLTDTKTGKPYYTKQFSIHKLTKL